MTSVHGSPERRVTRLRDTVRRRRNGWLYQDEVVRMDRTGIVIRHYYWPFGHKRIPFADIRSFDPRPLKAWHGQYRVQGIDMRGRWYSRDRDRGEKELAIDLDVGRRIRPILTPRDPDAVLEILTGGVSGSDFSESKSDESSEDENPEAWLL